MMNEMILINGQDETDTYTMSYVGSKDLIVQLFQRFSAATTPAEVTEDIRHLAADVQHFLDTGSTYSDLLGMYFFKRTKTEPVFEHVGWPGDGSGEDDFADFNQNEGNDW